MRTRPIRSIAGILAVGALLEWLAFSGWLAFANRKCRGSGLTIDFSPLMNFSVNIYSEALYDVSFLFFTVTLPR
jgi:hypothetical protein